MTSKARSGENKLSTCHINFHTLYKVKLAKKSYSVQVFLLFQCLLKAMFFPYAGLYLHNSLNLKVLVFQMYPLLFFIQLSELLN